MYVLISFLKHAFCVAIATSILISVLVLFTMLFNLIFDDNVTTKADCPDSDLVALLVTTNLVRAQCQCGYCHDNVVVPEHVNKIGYDLKEVVTTNYLPVTTTANGERLSR